MALKKHGFFSRLSARVTLLALFAVLAGGISSAARANDAPTTPCDPNYMNALEAKAFMEAQREIAQNQNLIVKPDSVLQYTCFGSFLNAVADDNSYGGDGPFSDDDARWGPVDGQGAGALGDSLTDVVGDALNTYLTNNFDNDYLGGRADSHWMPDDTVEGGDYDCKEMNTVWQDAQCMNFFNQADDGFFDFPWYVNNDPRQLPGPACTSGIDDGDEDQAFNNNTKNYTLDPENSYPGANTLYNADPVLTHLDKILPVGTAPAGDCAPPIRTGVCVVRELWTEVYADAVCPNPGCHYTAPPGPGGNGTPDTGPCATPDALPLGTCNKN